MAEAGMPGVEAARGSASRTSRPIPASSASVRKVSAVRAILSPSNSSNSTIWTSSTCIHRGAAPALQDVVAGHVHALFDSVLLAKEPLAAGLVRALAITAAKREPAVPKVPTLPNPACRGRGWSLVRLFAPAGTPRARSIE